MSDRVCVDGHRVGYMYRDDWGWNFFSGDEDRRYLDDAANLSLLTLNEAANFDRAILPYLNEPPGTAWIRERGGFVADTAGAPTATKQDGLNPEYPVLTGTVAISDTWAIGLPTPMNTRLERGSFVLWRPGLTAWLTVWGGGDGAAAERLERLKLDVPEHAYDRTQWGDRNVLRYAYRLAEETTDGRQPALYGVAVTGTSHAQAGIYFDTADDLGHARYLLEHLGPRQTH
ncbi:immunity protein Imm33 domain-containing protein (plasmid) [Mycolicibacterium psychrotolerans]|uniref:immunity protein Imm33 domain-containing protein n=1 Tax=Mycolicibacterium psychrotolerans TaxID=216929 RepID=UPI003D664B72